MTRICTLLVCAVLFVCGSVYAQEPEKNLVQKKTTKPMLFGALPDHFELDAPALRKLFDAAEAADIHSQLSSQFIVSGKVLEKNQPAAGVWSMNLRLSNYQNALFNLSLHLMPDNSSVVKGRIVHPKFGDVLVLEKEKGRYYFRRLPVDRFMPE